MPETLTIRQGATWVLSFDWLDPAGQPVDLTGCTARMQLRRNYGTPVLLELSTASGQLVLGGATGIIDLVVDAATTAALTTDSGVCDMQIVYPDGYVDVALAGRFQLIFAVTR